MRLAAIFIILMLGVTFTGSGQPSFDPCDVGRKAAEYKISSGKIYFPRLTVESSHTQRKILELDYGIADEIYDNGSDLSFQCEAECFFKAMKIEIDKRWGKDFLKKQKRIANMLDKKGIGYIEPRENGIADTLSNYLKQKHFLELAGKNYLVRIKISADKDIIDVGVLSGLPHATEISRDLDDYQLIRNAVHAIDKIYDPGQLRGQAVDSTLTFWIEL